MANLRIHGPTASTARAPGNQEVSDLDPACEYLRARNDRLTDASAAREEVAVARRFMQNILDSLAPDVRAQRLLSLVEKVASAPKAGPHQREPWQVAYLDLVFKGGEAIIPGDAPDSLRSILIDFALNVPPGPDALTNLFAVLKMARGLCPEDDDEVALISSFVQQALDEETVNRWNKLLKRGLLSDDGSSSNANFAQILLKGLNDHLGGDRLFYVLRARDGEAMEAVDSYLSVNVCDLELVDFLDMAAVAGFPGDKDLPRTLNALCEVAEQVCQHLATEPDLERLDQLITRVAEVAPFLAVLLEEETEHVLVETLKRASDALGSLELCGSDAKRIRQGAVRHIFTKIETISGCLERFGVPAWADAAENALHHDSECWRDPRVMYGLVRTLYNTNQAIPESCYAALQSRLDELTHNNPNHPEEGRKFALWGGTPERQLAEIAAFLEYVGTLQNPAELDRTIPLAGVAADAHRLQVALAQKPNKRSSALRSFADALGTADYQNAEKFFRALSRNFSHKPEARLKGQSPGGFAFLKRLTSYIEGWKDNAIPTGISSGTLISLLAQTYRQFRGVAASSGNDDSTMARNSERAKGILAYTLCWSPPDEILDAIENLGAASDIPGESPIVCAAAVIDGITRLLPRIEGSPNSLDHLISASRLLKIALNEFTNHLDSAKESFLPEQLQQFAADAASTAANLLADLWTQNLEQRSATENPFATEEAGGAFTTAKALEWVEILEVVAGDHSRYLSAALRINALRALISERLADNTEKAQEPKNCGRFVAKVKDAMNRSRDASQILPEVAAIGKVATLAYTADALQTGHWLVFQAGSLLDTFVTDGASRSSLLEFHRVKGDLLTAEGRLFLGLGNQTRANESFERAAEEYQCAEALKA